jgi:hypothetical protein
MVVIRNKNTCDEKNSKNTRTYYEEEAWYKKWIKIGLPIVNDVVNSAFTYYGTKIGNGL